MLTDEEIDALIARISLMPDEGGGATVVLREAVRLTAERCAEIVIDDYGRSSPSELAAAIREAAK